MEPSFPSSFAWDDEIVTDNDRNVFILEGPGCTFSRDPIPPARQPTHDLFIWEIEVLEIVPTSSSAAADATTPLICVGLASMDGMENDKESPSKVIDALPGDAYLHGAIGYFNDGTLRMSPTRANDANEQPRAARIQPYGCTFGLGDRIVCGWSPSQGLLWFCVNNHMLGRVPSPLFGPPGYWYTVVGVESGKVTIKARFALGFASPRALGLHEEAGYAPGAEFQFDNLFYHEVIESLVNQLSQKSGISQEVFRTFLERGLTDCEAVALTAEMQNGEVFDESKHKCEQEQLTVAILLLEMLVNSREKAKEVDASCSSSPPVSSSMMRRKEESSEKDGVIINGVNVLGPQDSHFCHTIISRARSTQLLFKRLTEEEARFAGAQRPGELSERLSKGLNERFHQNERLTNLFVRLEAIQEKETCPELRKKSQADQPPAPVNLLSLICRVRSGSRLDKFQAALHLTQLARMDKYRAQVLAAGGLPSLMHLLNRSPYEVEVQGATAIACLVPGVKDPALLLRYQGGIFTSLHLLLGCRSDGNDAGDQAIGAGGSSGSRSGGFGGGGKGGGGDLSTLSSAEWEDRSHRRRLIARALAHLTVVLQHEWKSLTATPEARIVPSQPSTSLAWACKTTSSRPGGDACEKPLECIVSLALAVARYPVPPHDQFEDIRSLGTFTGLNSRGGSMLTNGSSSSSGDSSSSNKTSNSDVEDEATVLAAFSIYQLARHESTKVILVNRGVLPILVDWLSSSHRELHRHSAGIIASLCCRPDGQRSKGSKGVLPDLTDDALPSSSSVYQQGWIDAQILAEGTVTHLLPLASSAELDTRAHVAQALANLSTHPQNRACLVRTGAVSSLVLLLADALRDLENEQEIAHNALNALFHLAMDQSYETTGDSARRSPCFLIAKEGGLVALTCLLQNAAEKSSLRMAATSTIAVMSQLGPVRLAMFHQPRLLEALLNIGATIGRDAEGQYKALASSSSASSLTPTSIARREEAMMASVEAVHVAFTLANLSTVGEECHEHRMVHCGAVPVLLSMCRSKHTEVIHQATRALAQLSRALIKGFTPQDAVSVPTPHGVEKVRPMRTVEQTQDEQLRLWQANDVLRTMLYLISSSNHLVQLEALKAISTLAKVEDFHIIIVQSALKDFLRLAVDSSGEKAMRALAEEILVALGFEGGLKDLEASGNDCGLLLDWWLIERELTDQKVALDELAFAIEAIVSPEDALLAGSAGAMSMTHRLGGGGNSNGGYPPPPPSHLDMIPRAAVMASPPPTSSGERERPRLGGVVKKLVSRVVEGQDMRLRDLLINCLTPNNDTQDQDEEYRFIFPGDRSDLSTIPIAGVQPPQRTTSGTGRDSLLSFLGCGRTTSEQSGGSGGSGNSSGSGGPMLGDLAWSSVTQGPVCVSEPGNLSFNLQRLMNRYFPSTLMQKEIIPLTNLGRHGLVGLESSPGTHRKNDFRALVMPSRRFFSFRREGRVITRIIKKHCQESDHWVLCFQDSSFEGEFCMSLLERLHLLPKIKSLVFRSTSSTPETALAYFVGGLPGNVRDLVFDKCLGRDSLQILGVTLRTKANSSQSLSLCGLSVRNHDHLRPADFYPLLDFFRRDQLEQEPSPLSSISKGGSLEGGSGLVDEENWPPIGKGVDSLSFANISRQSSFVANQGMRYLDLSGNKLGDVGCAEVLNAIKHSVSLISLDLSGNQINRGQLFLEALIGTTGLMKRKPIWLETLILDDNSLSSKFVQRFVPTLEEDTSLQTLSMASNGLQENKTMEAFRKLFRKNATLTDLNLSNNRIGVEGGRELLFGLLENQTMRFLRLGGNPSLKGEEKELIERQLRGNRRRFYSPVTGYRMTRSSVAVVPTVDASPSSNLVGSQTESKMEHPPMAGEAFSPTALAMSGPQQAQAASYVASYRSLEGQPLSKICSSCSITSKDDSSDDTAATTKSPRPVPHGPLRECPHYIQTLEHHRSFSAPVAQEAAPNLRHRGSDPNGEVPPRTPSSLLVGGVTELGRLHQASPPLRHHKSDDMSMSSGGANGGASTQLLDGKLSEQQQGGGQGLNPSSSAARKQDAAGGSELAAYDALESSLSNREHIEVLFSAPLAWRDLRGQLHPIEQIDIDQERELLIQSFQESGADVVPRFGFATTERLRSAVTLGAKALHYSGHGHKEGRLTFEDGEGGLQLVGVETLRSLCAAGEHKLELVTVSSCFSKLAGQAFAEAGVPHVVCVHVEAQLADSAALAFTRSFYLSIAVGHTVANAFEIGRQAVAASPNVPNSATEVSKFLLLPEGADHQVAIFPPPINRPPSGIGSGTLPISADMSWSQQQAHLPSPPEDFMGRETEQYMAISACLNRRLITLLGTQGIGKSSLASAVCHYMALRRKIADGIVMVRLRGRTTLEQLVQAIINAVDRQLGPSEHASASMSSSSTGGGGVETDLEMMLFSRLRPLRFLLVLDHTEDLQASQDGIDLKVFLRQLFDQTRFVKVLVTSSRPVDLHTLPGISAGEHLVSVGPLTFRYTVRLFSRLCPHLHTARERRLFFQSLVPPDQADVTIFSREITPRSMELLERLGGGHPGRILQLAYEMSEADVFHLLKIATQPGEKLLRDAGIAR